MVTPDDRTLRDVMDAVDGDAGDAHLYDGLAPMYEFIYDRHYDYGELADFAASHAPRGAERVLVGACGTGGTLARLAERYDATGVDRARGMLARAARRTDAPLVEADLTTFRAEGFDLYTVLGNSLAHLPDDGSLSDLLANAHATLEPGGAVLCDFLTAGALRDGYVTEDRFEGDRFVVERTALTTTEGETDLAVDARFSFAYAITDRERDETVRVGESMPSRAWDAEGVRKATLAAGFETASVLDGSVGHDGAVVARRGA